MDMTALEQRRLGTYSVTLQGGCRIVVSVEEPGSCPICGEVGIQRVFRTQFVLFAEAATPPDSVVITYRCVRGHVFFPSPPEKSGF
jgi:hypothetical protein